MTDILWTFGPTCLVIIGASFIVAVCTLIGMYVGGRNDPR